MSTGRICGRCFCDVVAVCSCRWRVAAATSTPTVNGVHKQHTTAVVLPVKRPRDALTTASPPCPSVFSVAQCDAEQFRKSHPPFVGTCRDVMKPYVRPSSAPVASGVRPESVLREALRRSLLAVSSTVAGSLRNLSDQLMSIRQDLTIQKVENSFAATVYEYHARVCVEAGQLPELGQCLNQLKLLHDKGHTGDRTSGLAPHYSNIDPPPNVPSKIEAAALRIAYRGLTSKYDDEIAMELVAYTFANSSKSNGQVIERSDRVEDHPYVAFAIRAVQALHNPAAYVALTAHAPCPYFASLLRLFIPKLRVEWLRSLVLGFQDFLPQRALAVWLGFGEGCRGEEAVTALLRPIVGEGLWRNGIVAARCREKVLAYILEITESKSTCPS